MYILKPPAAGILYAKLCNPDCLVQPLNSWSAPKSTGEGASSLFGGRPGSPENVSCFGATPRLHRCNLWVAERKKQQNNVKLVGHDSSADILGEESRRRAEYGFGEYGFKHRTQ